ncbi:hypothetical protein HZA55_05090 [Candidatus Poribacteria bacterium]|nr:hypothetical protein [Candidatus Poribacteria bacterium]
MDAIILAGDQKKSIKLYKENKAFLILIDKPVFIHVLKNISLVQEIDRIFIVGPKNQLDDYIDKYKTSLPDYKKIFTVEQKESILENGMEGFLQSIPEYNNKTLSLDRIKIKYAEKAALFLSVDIPLVMTEEISYFISKCDLGKHDYFTGITPKSVMETYYPTSTDPGIIMAYLHFKEDLYRISNLHIIKPFKGNIYYINRMYEVRYQKKIINKCRFIKYIWDAPNTFDVCKYYMSMQLALSMRILKLNIFSDFIRRFIPINKIENVLSMLMNERFKAIELPFGGAAIDIDNEKDFQTLQLMLDKWQKKQRAFYEKLISVDKFSK